MPKPQAKGAISIRYTKHGVVAQKWPAKGKPIRTYMRAAGVGAFQWAIQQIKDADPMDVQAAIELVKGTGLMPRDALLAAMYGKGIEFTTEDGTTYRHLAMSERSIQGLLDTISNVPGTILYRDNDTWRGLEPGVPGQVLQTNGPAEVPTWENPGGAGGGYPGNWLLAPVGASNHAAGANSLTIQGLFVPRGYTVTKLGFWAMATNPTVKFELGLYKDFVLGTGTKLSDGGGIRTGTVAKTYYEFTLDTPYLATDDVQVWAALNSNGGGVTYLQGYGPSTVILGVGFTGTTLPPTITGGSTFANPIALGVRVA